MIQNSHSQPKLGLVDVQIVRYTLFHNQFRLQTVIFDFSLTPTNAII